MMAKAIDVPQIRISEIINQGNLALIDELFDPNFVDHSTPEQVSGPEGVKNFVFQLQKQPPFQVIIKDLIAENDKVVVRTTWETLPENDEEPGGTFIFSSMIQIFRIREGKILEEWNEGSGLS